MKTSLSNNKLPTLRQWDIAPAIKHINGRGGACSAQSGRGKQRPYIMGCDV
jgi:hypothetical protein